VTTTANPPDLQQRDLLAACETIAKRLCAGDGTQHWPTAARILAAAAADPAFLQLAFPLPAHDAAPAPSSHAVILSADDLAPCIAVANGTEYGSSPAVNIVHHIARRALQATPDRRDRVQVYVDIDGGMMQTVYATAGVTVDVELVDADLEGGLSEDVPAERQELLEREATRAAMDADRQSGAVSAVW